MLIKKQLQNKLLNPRSIPSNPRQKLRSDIFEYKSNQCILVADYYSKFLTIRKLAVTTSTDLIISHKARVTESSILEVLITNSGPQCNRGQFAIFCNQWRITHFTTAPAYFKVMGLLRGWLRTFRKNLKRQENIPI